MVEFPVVLLLLVVFPEVELVVPFVACRRTLEESSKISCQLNYILSQNYHTQNSKAFSCKVLIILMRCGFNLVAFLNELVFYLILETHINAYTFSYTKHLKCGTCSKFWEQKT